MSVALAQTSAQFGNDVFRGAPRSHDGGNHANDRQYSTLRDRAREAQSKHMHFAAEASKAYNSGDKEQASAYSTKSKQYQSEAEKLNDEAASWVFVANNTDSAKDEIDLHGLYVKEALVALDARIQVCRQNGQPLLKAIVGKGLHSETHIAKLRPAVMEHCNQQRIPNTVDKNNAGVVLLDLSGGNHAQNYSQGYNQGYSQQQGYSQGNYNYPQQQPQYQYQQQNATGSQQGGVNILRLIGRLLSQCLN